MPIRQTHTYVELEISEGAFEEIKQKLEAAGYQHTFMEDGAVIDMHGIAVKSDGLKVDTVIDFDGTVRGKPLPYLRGIR